VKCDAGDYVVGTFLGRWKVNKPYAVYMQVILLMRLKSVMPRLAPWDACHPDSVLSGL